MLDADHVGEPTQPAKDLDGPSPVDRIIQAALQVFAERGGDGTITEISEAAGVSRGLLFHYFGSKEGILQAVDAHACAEVADIFEAPSKLRGLDGLRRYLEARREFFERRPHVARLMTMLDAEAIAAKRARPEVLAIQDRKLELFTRWISEAVEDGTLRADIDVDKFALLATAVTDGDIRIWGMDPTRRPIEDTNAAILQMFDVLSSTGGR